MSYFRCTSLIVFFFGAFISCNKEKPAFNIVQTSEVFRLDNSNVLFTAKILNKSKDIIEYGFKWELLAANGTVLKNYLNDIQGIPEGDYFQSKISASMESGNTYRVRAYIKTPISISYGRYVSFVALGSEAMLITGFKPDTVTWGDTLTIIGRNFGYSINDVSVSSGNFNLPVAKLKNDTIIATIPDSYLSVSSQLKVSVLSNSSISSKNLVLGSPLIYSFVPDTGGFNTLVTLNGKYFHASTNTQLKVNGLAINSAVITRKSIAFRFPSSMPEGNSIFNVKVFNQQISSQGKFYNSAPRIKSFDPVSGISGTIVTIEGQFFVTGNTTVQLGGVNATVQSVNDTVIKFIVPNNISGGPLNLKVTVDNKSTIAASKFDRLAPIIFSFSPLLASYGDTISIYGDRFSDVTTENIVKFGTFQAVVTYASNQVLKVKVPTISNLSTCKIYVTRSPEITVSLDNFTLKNPLIVDFSPKTGTFLDTITIYAKYLHPDNSKILVTIGGITQTPVFRNPDLIKVVVSTGFVAANGISAITVKSDILTSVSSDKFQINTPVIDSISPFASQFGDIVTLFGKSFNPNITYSTININEAVQILSASPNKITFKIPYTTNGQHNFTYTTGGINVTKINAMQVNNPFEIYELSEPFYMRTDAFSFSIGNKLYIGSGRNSQARYGGILEFNTTDRSWRSFYSDGYIYYGATGFSIGTKGYYLYNKKLVEVDPISSSVKVKAVFPGNGINEHSAFVINNKAYIATGLDINSSPLNEVWEYDPVLDSWTRKADYPGGPMAYGIGFALGNKGYVGLGTPNQRDLWEYDPANNTWLHTCTVPDLVTNIAYDRISAICFTINDKAYIGTGFSKKSSSDYFSDLYEFVPSTNSWRKIEPIPSSFGFARANAFSIGTDGYIIGGDRDGSDQYNLFIMNSGLLK